MKLSRNFTLSELTKSDTAIRKGIDNNPNAEQVDKLKLLCEKILQPIRDHFGRVKVTSGYRSPQLCAAIGSSLNSQHARAEACDFECIGISNAELSDWIHMHLEYDQLILEFWNPSEKNSGWVHCSYTEDQPRHSYLRAFREDGRVKYKPILGAATQITE